MPRCSNSLRGAFAELNDEQEIGLLNMFTGHSVKHCSMENPPLRDSIITFLLHKPHDDLCLRN